MKKINKHNYELFFLDFAEGNLSKSQIKDLNKFLSNNPDLRIQYKSFKNVTLKPKQIKYEKKEKLIKQTQSKLFDITHFEYLLIAELEKDNSVEEEKELEKLINKKTEQALQLSLYKKTKLKANESIVYPLKNQLKRRVIPIYFKISSYAAALIIAMFLIVNQFSFYNINQTNAASLTIVEKNNTNIVKAIKKTKQNNKQEKANSHNQTNKLTAHKILAFDDNEPQNEVNLYKNLNVLIPDLKKEALIFKTTIPELKKTYCDITSVQPKPIEKDKLWQYAETGVKVWKLISSSDLEMNNKYKEDGSIEKLNVYASNIRFSKTFNR